MITLNAHRSLFAALILVIVSAGCTGTTAPAPSQVPAVVTPAPQPGTPVVRLTRTPVPTLPYTDPARTIAPASGPTLAGLPSVSLKFAESAPPFIGRWTLDKNKSYVAKGGEGAVLMYNVPGLGDIQVSLWVIFNPQIPNYNTGNAIERYTRELSLITTEKIPFQLGDQAMLTPGNRNPQAKTGANPTVLAILQWRNVVIDVYATADLMKTNFDFSADEARLFLTKMFEAIPKP